MKGVPLMMWGKKKEKKEERRITPNVLILRGRKGWKAFQEILNAEPPDDSDMKALVEKRVAEILAARENEE